MRCKIGDIAVIIRGFIGSRNVGRLVEVVAPAKSSDRDWIVKSLGSHLYTRTGNFCEFVETHDHRLRPIRGEPETVDKQESVTA